MPKLERILHKGDVRPYTRYDQTPYRPPDLRPPKPTQPPEGVDSDAGEWRFYELPGPSGSGRWEWWPEGGVSEGEQARRDHDAWVEAVREQAKQDPDYLALKERYEAPGLGKYARYRIEQMMEGHVQWFFWRAVAERRASQEQPTPPLPSPTATPDAPTA